MWGPTASSTARLRLRRSVALCVALATTGLGTSARAAEPVSIAVGAHHLVLQLPAWDLVAGNELDDQLLGYWAGTAGESTVYLEVRAYPEEKYRLAEPDDVVRYTVHVLQDPKYGGHEGFDFASQRRVAGPFGSVPAARLAQGPLRPAGAPAGEIYVLAGVLPRHAYGVRLVATPPLDASNRESAIALLTGIRSDCPPRDPKWTADELAGRLARAVPDEKVRKKFKPPVRTKHYVILTDSGAGKLFSEKMEDCYTKIRAVFPFDEPPDARLMPVWLFRSKEEYVQFCADFAKDKSLGQNSKGHAWMDYYATYYDSPNDPVHIHEATHQLFMNRLGLEGGGSWFQEGVAEYMCTQPGDRKGYAKQAVRDKAFVPFDKLVTVRELLSDPSIDGSAAYTQAACIIEFVRDGKWHDDKFQEFVHRMGAAPYNDGREIETILKDLYRTDLEQFQAAWEQYWHSR